MCKVAGTRPAIVRLLLGTVAQMSGIGNRLVALLVADCPTSRFIGSALRLPTLSVRDRVARSARRPPEASSLQGHIKPFTRDLPDHDATAHTVTERGTAALGAEFLRHGREHLVPEIAMLVADGAELSPFCLGDGMPVFSRNIQGRK